MGLSNIYLLIYHESCGELVGKYSSPMEHISVLEVSFQKFEQIELTPRELQTVAQGNWKIFQSSFNPTGGYVCSI